MNFIRTGECSSFDNFVSAKKKYGLLITHCFAPFRTDPHLIAWFSAGAFVLLGFPISMWGIVKHLSNYNKPKLQKPIIKDSRAISHLNVPSNKSSD